MENHHFQWVNPRLPEGIGGHLIKWGIVHDASKNVSAAQRQALHQWKVQRLPKFGVRRGPGLVLTHKQN
jgi:hypothetical protein